MAKQMYSIELEERQYQYLEAMVNKHNLPDVSKALRIMTDFVIENSDQEDDVFERIRCLDC